MKGVFLGMLLALVCFVSCEEKSGVVGVPESKSSADTVSDAYIKGLLQTLESSECVCGPRVGITGEESITYNCFVLLDQNLTDSGWFKLSASPSPVVRTYAFKALVSRNSKLIPSVKGRLRNDTAVICDVSVDLRMSYSIGEYVSLPNFKINVTETNVE